MKKNISPSFPPGSSATIVPMLIPKKGVYRSIMKNDVKNIQVATCFGISQSDKLCNKDSNVVP